MDGSCNLDLEFEYWILFGLGELNPPYPEAVGISLGITIYLYCSPSHFINAETHLLCITNLFSENAFDNF